jgi:hypothetical protein
LFWGEQQAIVAFVAVACNFLTHENSWDNLHRPRGEKKRKSTRRALEQLTICGLLSIFPNADVLP